MDDTLDNEEIAAPATSVGEQLRAAREAKGLSLEQVAAETRIPQRHLLAIEGGDFARLPGRTYAVGFSRTYAKAVGLDQDDVGAIVRGELDAQTDSDEYRPATFEPGDPARAPSRTLFYFSIFAGLLAIAGIAMFVSTLFSPAGELPSLVSEQDTAKAPATARPGAPAAVQQAAPDPSGAVVFTALEQGIWVKFYDASGKQLMQKQMDKGERYAVPADARGPQVWTGRPDALAITIGGKRVPMLAETEQVMRDVPVTAAALLARAQDGATAGENPPPPTT